MSTNLYWEPAERKKHKAGEDAGLKWALQKKYGSPVSRTMGHQNIPYLEGLRDGGIKGVQELIDAIETYENIEIFEE